MNRDTIYLLGSDCVCDVCSLCLFLCVFFFYFVYIYAPVRLHSNESISISDGHRAPLYFLTGIGG